MPHAVGFTYRTDEERFEGKISEVCARSPLIPVQLSIVIGGREIIFYKKARVREGGELVYVDYESDNGLRLRVVNDLR